MLSRKRLARRSVNFSLKINFSSEKNCYLNFFYTLHAKTLVVENRSKLVNQNSPLILSFQQTKTISKLLSLEIYKLEDELSFILTKETRSKRCLFDARIRSKAWHNSRATTLTIKVTNSLFLLIIHDVHLFKRRRKKINSVRQRERDKT